MKRLFSVILISAALLGASFTSSAQYFNHMYLGVGAGTDGGTVQIGLPVGPLLQIRAGASYMPPLAINYTVPNIHFYGSVSGDVDLTATMAYKSINALVDFFPGKNTRFHLSAGAYYSPAFFGDGVWANVTGTTNALDPADYGTAGYMIGDHMVTTDSEGALHGYAATKKLLPYFGFGSGRAVAQNSVVSFLFDLGVLYLGSDGFGAYTEGLNIKNGQKETILVTSESLDNKDKGLLDMAASFPVYPVMKFSLFVKLF